MRTKSAANPPRPTALEDLGFDADLTAHLRDALEGDPLAAAEPPLSAASPLPIGAPPKRLRSPQRGEGGRQTHARTEGGFGVPGEEEEGDEEEEEEEPLDGAGWRALTIERVHQSEQDLRQLGVLPGHTPRPFDGAVTNALVALYARFMESPSPPVRVLHRDMLAEAGGEALSGLMATFHVVATNGMDPDKTLSTSRAVFMGMRRPRNVAMDPVLLNEVVVIHYSALLFTIGRFSDMELLNKFVGTNQVVFDPVAWNHLVIAYMIAHPAVASSTDLREHLLMFVWVALLYGYLEHHIAHSDFHRNLADGALMKMTPGTHSTPQNVGRVLVGWFATANHVTFTPLSSPPTLLDGYIMTRDTPEKRRAVALAEQLRWAETFASVLEMIRDSVGDPVDVFLVSKERSTISNLYEGSTTVPAEYAGTEAERLYREGLARRRADHGSLWRRSRAAMLKHIKNGMEHLSVHMCPEEPAYFHRLIVDRWAAAVDDVWGGEGDDTSARAVERIRDTRIHAWHVATQIVRVAVGDTDMLTADIMHNKTLKIVINPYWYAELRLINRELPIATILAMWLADPFGDMDHALMRAMQEVQRGESPSAGPRNVFELNVETLRTRGSSREAIAEDPDVLRERPPSVEVALQARQRLLKLEKKRTDYQKRLEDAQRELGEMRAAIPRLQERIEVDLRERRERDFYAPTETPESLEWKATIERYQDRIPQAERDVELLRNKIDAARRHRSILEQLLKYHEEYTELASISAEIEELRREVRGLWTAAERRGEDVSEHRERMREILAEKERLETLMDDLAALPANREDLEGALEGIVDSVREVIRFGKRDHTLGFQMLYNTITVPLSQLLADAESELSATTALVPPNYDIVQHREIVLRSWRRSPGRIDWRNPPALVVRRVPLPHQMVERDDHFVHAYRQILGASIAYASRVEMPWEEVESSPNPRDVVLRRGFHYNAGHNDLDPVPIVIGELLEVMRHHRLQFDTMTKSPNLGGAMLAARAESFHEVIAYRGLRVTMSEAENDFYDAFTPSLHHLSYYVMRTGWGTPLGEDDASGSGGGREAAEGERGRVAMAMVPPVERANIKNWPFLAAWILALMELMDKAVPGALDREHAPGHRAFPRMQGWLLRLDREKTGQSLMWKHRSHARHVMEVLGRVALVLKFRLLRIHRHRKYGWFSDWWESERQRYIAGSENRRYLGTYQFQGWVFALRHPRNLEEGRRTPGATLNLAMALENNPRMEEFAVLWNGRKITRRLQTMAMDLVHYLGDDIKTREYEMNPYAVRRSPDEVAAHALMTRMQEALTAVYPVIEGGAPPEARFFAEVVWPLWMNEGDALGRGERTKVGYREALWHAELTRIRIITGIAPVEMDWSANQNLYLAIGSPLLEVRPPGMGYLHLAYVAFLALVHEEFLENPDVRRLDYAAVLARYARYFVEPLELEAAEMRAPAAMETEGTTTTTTTTSEGETPMELS